MGSSFGKVRKYSLNPAGEQSSSSFKYTPAEDGATGPLSEPMPPRDKRQPRRLTPHEKVEKYDPKPRRPTELVDMFSTGYPPYVHPEYYGLHGNEELLIPSKDAQYDVRTMSEQRDYKPPDRGKSLSAPSATLHPAPSPPSDTAPPLPPRNRIGMEHSLRKPDTAFGPNPRPRQKFYSAEDINKVLKPLNTYNKANTQSAMNSQRNSDLYVEPPLKHYNTWAPSNNYNSHVCDHHKRQLSEGRCDVLPHPPPYKYSPLYKNGSSVLRQNYDQQSVYPPNHQYNSNAPRNHQNDVDPRKRVPAHHIRYNTIPNDTNISFHQRHYNDFNNSKLRTTSSSKHIYQPVKHRPEALTDSQQFSYGQHDRFHIPKTINNRTEGEKYQHSLRHHPESTRLFREPEAPYSTVFSPHHCYTIPEEDLWLPTFHHGPPYHTLHPTGYNQ